MDREKFIELQTSIIDQIFGLTSGEENPRERIRQLAIDTYVFLVSMGVDYALAFEPWPESAGNPLRGSWWGTRNDSSRSELAPDLIRRWQNWNDEYFDIRARNPRLELRDMMQHISESHNASSWPAGDEGRIQDWVDGGNPSALPPFDDRYSIVTPEFFNRLRALRQTCGGWLHWNADLKRIVFTPETEWQSVRAAQQAAKAKEEKDRQESEARLQRCAIRLQQVISIARSDRAFWEVLRTWELEREANRPSKLPSPRPFAGQVTHRIMSPEEQAKAANPPVDQIFAAFIARVCEPGDVLTVSTIVLNLRSEMRRELGLDHVLAWPDGPGIGHASRPNCAADAAT